MKMRIVRAQVTREMLAAFPWRLGMIEGRPGSGKTHLTRRLWLGCVVRSAPILGEPLVIDNFQPTIENCGDVRRKLAANPELQIVVTVTQAATDKALARLGPDWIITTDWSPSRDSE